MHADVDYAGGREWRRSAAGLGAISISVSREERFASFRLT
jgi:hypothetical protein